MKIEEKRVYKRIKNEKSTIKNTELESRLKIQELRIKNKNSE